MRITAVRSMQDPPLNITPLPADQKDTSRARKAPVRQPYRNEGNFMAFADSQTLERLRKEENTAEQQGRQAMNTAKMLKNHPQYDLARQKADALLAKAAALREQIHKIEMS